MAQRRLLRHLDVGNGDAYGASIAISGDWAVVGAPSSDLTLPDREALFLLSRDALDDWGLGQRLPFVLGVGDALETSVSLDQDALLAGMPGSSAFGQGAGAAVVVRRVAPGLWVLSRYLSPTDRPAGRGLSHPAGYWSDWDRSCDYLLQYTHDGEGRPIEERVSFVDQPVARSLFDYVDLPPNPVARERVDDDLDGEFDREILHDAWRPLPIP